MFFISCGKEQSNTENITDGPRHPAPQKLAAAFPIVTMQRAAFLLVSLISLFSVYNPIFNFFSKILV